MRYIVKSCHFISISNKTEDHALEVLVWHEIFPLVFEICHIWLLNHQCHEKYVI